MSLWKWKLHIINNNKALVLKRDQLWILDKLDWISHMNSFPPFYPVWNHALHYFPKLQCNFLWPLIKLFLAFLYLFSFPQLTLSYQFITCTPLDMTKQFQTTLPIFSSIGVPLSLKGFPHFESSLSVYSCLSISTFLFPLLWICCFLTTQHLIT